MNNAELLFKDKAIIRYLVGARERRRWKSELSLRITEELNKPEYADRIISVYPRQQIQFVNQEGAPIEIKDFQPHQPIKQDK